MLTVTSIREHAEPDGSHVIEMGDEEAVIPADCVVRVQAALQVALSNRVMAQARRLDVPTEATLSLIELHLLEARPAPKGTETNLLCNLREIGWLAFAASDDALRQLRGVIDGVLNDRGASRQMN